MKDFGAERQKIKGGAQGLGMWGVQSTHRFSVCRVRCVQAIEGKKPREQELKKLPCGICL